MMTKEQYIESLRKLNLKVYFMGELISNPVDHPMIRPSMNSVAMTYELAEKDEYKTLMTAKSNLTGKTVNRFCHLHQSTEDLINKVKMQRLVGQKTGACFQRCVGMDAFNAIYSTTYEIDQAHGTEYHKRFTEYLKYVQDNDLTVDGAMTDPKGDRGLSPSQQEDPDLYLRIKEVRPDGIIVRGAKAHQTGAVNSHEHLIMPTVAMKESDKDYAVSFAIPSDAEGVLMIYGRQSCDTRKMEKDADLDLGNSQFGGHEALVIFDDVFVPNERIFMCKEYEFAGAFTVQGGIAAGEYFCRLPEMPTAVACANDMIAIGVMQYLQRIGKRVPEDVSVVGMPNISIPPSPPSATTVRNLPIKRWISYSVVSTAPMKANRANVFATDA